MNENITQLDNGDFDLIVANSPQLKIIETVKNPSQEVLNSMFQHAINAKVGGNYTWEKYMRDLYFLAVSDILDEFK